MWLRGSDVHFEIALYNRFKRSSGWFEIGLGIELTGSHSWIRRAGEIWAL